MKQISSFWIVEFSDLAQKQLKKIDRENFNRIIDYLETRVAPAQNPKVLAQPLTGNLSGLWRFRVGDWRLICEIRDKELIILVAEIGHRKEVYRPYR